MNLGGITHILLFTPLSSPVGSPLHRKWTLKGYVINLSKVIQLGKGKTQIMPNLAHDLRVRSQESEDLV